MFQLIDLFLYLTTQKQMLQKKFKKMLQIFSNSKAEHTVSIKNCGLVSIRKKDSSSEQTEKQIPHTSWIVSFRSHFRQLLKWKSHSNLLEKRPESCICMKFGWYEKIFCGLVKFNLISKWVWKHQWILAAHRAHNCSIAVISSSSI